MIPRLCPSQVCGHCTLLHAATRVSAQARVWWCSGCLGGLGWPPWNHSVLIAVGAAAADPVTRCLALPAPLPTAEE
jgi:hypothetical protein